MIETSQFTEVALSRWGSSSLVALVEVRQDAGVLYLCLTFTAAKASESANVIEPTTTVVMRSEGNPRILALPGTRQGDLLVAVIGWMTHNKPGAIETGQMRFDGCPNPESISGCVGASSLEYDAQSFDFP